MKCDRVSDVSVHPGNVFPCECEVGFIGTTAAFRGCCFAAPSRR